MLVAPADPDTLCTALLARDPAFDGHPFVGLTSTGIVCRLTCPAREPRRENARFLASAAECLEAGFRPCRRCRPLDRMRGHEPIVDDRLRRREAEPDRLWREGDVATLGHDPSTVHRTCKCHVGVTFLDLARLRRAGRGMDRLAAGAPVIEAQVEAGFASGSGFREAVGRWVRECPADLRGRELLRADVVETPIGPMIAVADAHALHLLQCLERKALPAELDRLRRTARSAIGCGRTAPSEAVAGDLAAYLAGVDAGFATPLAMEASAFTREVWQALRAIPSATARSDGEIARDLGRPASARAVAHANPIAILVPCHRVIGGDGALTGYGGGLWRKRWLLEHERRMASPEDRRDGRPSAASLAPAAEREA